MCKQYVQLRDISDHCAIVVKSMIKDWGPRQFRTLDAWSLEYGFKEMVKAKWNSYPTNGNELSLLKKNSSL